MKIINMNFSTALQYLKRGAIIYRESEKDILYKLEETDEHMMSNPASEKRCIIYVNAITGAEIPEAAIDVDDILATDWAIFSEISEDPE